MAIPIPTPLPLQYLPHPKPFSEGEKKIRPSIMVYDVGGQRLAPIDNPTPICLTPGLKCLPDSPSW